MTRNTFTEFGVRYVSSMGGAVSVTELVGALWALLWRAGARRRVAGSGYQGGIVMSTVKPVSDSGDACARAGGRHDIAGVSIADDRACGDLWCSAGAIGAGVCC